ncbi:EsaB/YukD family protein [Frankia sp. AiPs1]|uniref:EsaB/YukD family protein n=1 Tax=Frankia sp. AiPs1 TaxID=573493 RepID=UPI002043777A|nr:EsaB/YukD family protein [Frankia sp. AiPs1]MCM3921853.1 EsaB/YukD family protein [Frankia sp. AiPs1]
MSGSATDPPGNIGSPAWPKIRRVTIQGAGLQADMTLPADLAIGLLEPRIAAVLRVFPTARHDDFLQDWKLQRIGGPPLSSWDTLADAGIRSGDILLFSVDSPPPPSPIVTDLIQITRASVDDAATAGAELPGRLLRGLAAVLLLAGAAMLGLGRRPGAVEAAVGLMGAVLLTVLTALPWTWSAAPRSACGYFAVAYAAAGGYALGATAGFAVSGRLVTAASGAIVLASVGLAIHGLAVLPLMPAVLVAGAEVLVTSAIAAAAGSSEVPVVGAAVVLTAMSIFAVPAIVVRLVPLDAARMSLSESRGAEEFGDGAEQWSPAAPGRAARRGRTRVRDERERTARARTIARGLLVGMAGSIAAGLVLVAAVAPGFGAASFVLVTSVLVLLRARTFRRHDEVIPLLIAGGAGTVAFVAAVAARASDQLARFVLAVLVAGCLLIAADHVRRSADTRRGSGFRTEQTLNAVEILLIVLLVPLSAAQFGIFAMVGDLAARPG